jgi:hypothetical protein
MNNIELDLVEWCVKNRFYHKGRLTFPDFFIKWGGRSGYTVTIRIKKTNVLISRTHKQNLQKALELAYDAVKETSV